MVGGSGVFVGNTIGTGVLVGVFGGSVLVGRGVFVGSGVFVASGVLVGVLVGSGAVIFQATTGCFFWQVINTILLGVAAAGGYAVLRNI